MPIQQTKAQLWQPTKEAQDAYDDKMIANIELKSLDFDDENFSPVFNRNKQEFFLGKSEKYKEDISRMIRPLRALSYEQVIDKYVLIKPNHTYYREWTINKFLSSFGLGYLVLRELPLRNFYARCFVMYVLIAKIGDHMTHILPYHGGFQLFTIDDKWTNKEVNTYHNAFRAANITEIPSAMNRIKESQLWASRQPGHLIRQDFDFAPHYFTFFSRHNTQAHWDGTFNQPLHRLADPYHKDAYMIHWT